MTHIRPFALIRLLPVLALALALAACGLVDDRLDVAPAGAGLPPLADGPVPADFSAFVEGLRPAARRSGVSDATFDRAFAGVGPDMDVLRRAGAQPEFSRPIWDYLDDMTADSRIATGREMLARRAPLLDRVEAAYGVERQVVVAVWGMESSYGAILGDPTKVKNVVRALSTLAWKGGARAGYGRQQLMAALRILERRDIDSRRMTGSWAGAMGHTQFIPTTYLAYAVDFDGDGRRDIWTSEADALASTANYLKRAGWQSGATWGYEVTLPPGFDSSLAGVRAPISVWLARGVRRANGDDFPRPGDIGRLFLPAGVAGPAFLTLRNFDVIKRYNAADAYALAVGHLADRLIGGGPFVASWPRGYEPLDEAGRAELQGRLRALGYQISKIDGKIGPESVDAIRRYQASAGLAVDGNASLELLGRLRAGG